MTVLPYLLIFYYYSENISGLLSNGLIPHTIRAMTMSHSEIKPKTPRAVIHKQILDIADSNPDASMEELADETVGASTALVERVLDEYGDPAAETDPDSSMTQENNPPDIENLSEQQVETLTAIHENPTAPQEDIANLLDVSGATVSQRVNSISGFKWKNRQNISEAILSNGMKPEQEVMDSQEATDPTEQLTQRISAIEQQVEEVSNKHQYEFKDIELSHKVIHACMKSDFITEDEEIRVLKIILQ